MKSVMRTRVVKIGNSQGIRIPKVIVDQFNLGEEIELLSKDGLLVIRPVTHPRDGWEEKFAAMAKRGDDRILDASQAADAAWDDEEWEW